MKKQIIITECETCPYCKYAELGYECSILNDDMLFVPFDGYIRDDCPLKTLEE